MSRGLPRVLVLTGTSDHPFSRLLDALPGLVRDGVASEVRVQSRVPPPAAAGIVALGMLPRAALEREMREADVVVSHGGSGSIFDALRAGHRPIVVPRRAHLREHVDDHQEDVARALAQSGVATVAGDPLAESLPPAVAEAARHPRSAVAPSPGVGGRLRELAARIAPRFGPRGASRPAIRVRRASASEFGAFYRSAPWPHPLQSVAWGEARRLDGWRAEWWLASRDDGEPVVGAQILRRSRLLPQYLPYGPVCADSPAASAASDALLRVVARRSLCGLLWAPYPSPSPTPSPTGSTSRLACVEVRPPSSTGFVPLGSDDELRARMRGTWRRDLDHALADLAVTPRFEESADSVRAVLERVHALARSRAFRAPLRADLGAAFAAAAPTHGVTLLTLVVDQAGHRTDSYVASIVGGRAQTLWTAHEPGGSAGAGRVALFALLRACRDRGARIYDLAGIDDEGNPGVASFKRGLRPEIREVPGLRWLVPFWLPRGLASAAVRIVVGARDRVRAE